MFDERDFDEKFTGGEERTENPETSENARTDESASPAENVTSEAANAMPAQNVDRPAAGEPQEQTPHVEPYPFAAETAINSEGVASEPGYPTGRDYEPVRPAVPQQPTQESPRPMFNDPAPSFNAQQSFNTAAEQAPAGSGRQYAPYGEQPYSDGRYAPQNVNNGYEQPYYYAAPPAQKPPKKKHKALRRLIAALLVLTVIGGAVGTFAILYDVHPNDDGGITISRRGSGNAEKNDGDSDVSVFASPVPGGSQAVVSPNPAGNGGPEMQINDSPVSQVDYGDTGKALTNQEIAAKCTQWTVGVIATSYYENNYFGYGGAATSTGTGIIMSSDGYIITNCHVVDGATDLSVRMLNGTEYAATLIGMDDRSDLAVLKIDATGLPAAEFGDSDALLVGDPVIAIGNPLGLELMGTVTDGIVSAINRDVAVDERTMTLIQTNAAINAGNSGGPLINQYGQVIGINTLKMQDYSTTVEGLGFAIPTNTAKAIVDELIEHGYVSGYPAIGLRCDNVSQSMSARYSIPIGVLVRYVHPDSNAYRAGLQVNDVIVEAQGEKVENYSDLSTIMDRYHAGDSFELKVFHYDSRAYETLHFVLNDENDLSDGSVIAGD